MGRDLRFIVLNSDDAFGNELRALARQLTGIKIVAEVDEPALLEQAVKQFPVEVIFVNLDPSPDAVLPVIGEVARAEPEVAIFAASQSTDGQLILKALRAGAREFFPRPVEAKTLEEAIEKVAAQRADAPAHGKLITVMGVAGGVGATMLATNMAVELAGLTEGLVTLVDLDYRFGQVATLLDVDPTYTLADLTATPERLEQTVINRALVKHRSGVRILSRPTHFVQADTITGASCAGLLTSLLQFNEYVVADGPTRFDLNARAVLDLADVNLLVVQLLVPHVRNAVRILEGMREAGCNLSHLKLVCNRVGRDAGHLSVKDVSDTLSLPVFATIPDEWTTVSGAINLGEELSAFGPKSKVRQAILEIAATLHTPQGAADDMDAPKKGLIGRIFAPS